MKQRKNRPEFGSNSFKGGVRIAAVLAILALVAGCGGDGETETTPTGSRSIGSATAAVQDSQLSKAKTVFIANADAICHRVHMQTRSKPGSYETKDLIGVSEARARAIVDRVVNPGLEEEIRKIVALRPPAGVSDASEGVLNAIAEMIVQAQANPREFLLERDVVAESEAKARAKGFKVCGGI